MNAAEDYDDALICCIENSVKSWVMDSGASFHAFHNKEIMSNVKPYNGTVHLVDGKTMKITGIRDVALRTSMGTTQILKDVKYISDLNKMLILWDRWMKRDMM